MDYQKTMCEMLMHLEQNKSPEAKMMFMRCCAFGIANISSSVNNMDAQAEILENVFCAIRSEAKDIFVARHGGVSTADYLKHIFTPGVPNA